MLRTYVAAATFLALSSTLGAQSPVATIGTEQFMLTSRGNGVEYRIDVWLPAGLDTMTVRPPIFVVTDGNLAFHTAHEVNAMLGISGEASPLIIVGVSYPEKDGRGYTPIYAASRTRDYTPTNIASWPGGGGSAAFVAFLRDELIPFVEGRYRADSTQRGLGGHSLGGLFATYVLLQHPGIFSRYWIGSPSLWWDAPLAFTWVGQAKQQSTKPHGRVYLTVGGDESDVMVPPMRRMAAELKRAFPTLRVGSQVFPDESHGSVVGPSLSRAMRFLYGDFGRPTIPISPATRAEFTGDWTAAGFTVHLRPSPSGLQMSFIYGGNKLVDEMFAASRDTLFTRKTGATQWVAVRDAKGKITSLRGTLLGATQEYTRAAKR